MSVDKALEFINEACENESLGSEIGNAVSGMDHGDASDEIAKVASKHGYDFTAQEAETVRAALRQQLIEDEVLDTELTDEELEAVAGGVSFKYKLGKTAAYNTVRSRAITFNPNQGVRDRTPGERPPRIPVGGFSTEGWHGARTARSG